VRRKWDFNPVFVPSLKLTAVRTTRRQHGTRNRFFFHSPLPFASVAAFLGEPCHNFMQSLQRSLVCLRCREEAVRCCVRPIPWQNSFIGYDTFMEAVHAHSLARTYLCKRSWPNGAHSLTKERAFYFFFPASVSLPKSGLSYPVLRAEADWF